MVAIQAPPGGGSGTALDFLQARGIPYDAWPIPAEVAALQAKPALSDDEKAAVLAAFRPRLESENEARGYIMADMVVLSPETPGLDEMLAKFDKAHYHDDDEVRYIFAGEGVFGFEPEDGEPFRRHRVGGRLHHRPRGDVPLVHPHRGPPREGHPFVQRHHRLGASLPRVVAAPPLFVPPPTRSKMADLIRATYIVSSPEPFDAEKKALGIALGQTTDTWTPTERGGLERLERHRGRVLAAGEAAVRDGVYTAEVTVGYPPENTEGDVATLLVMVFGKVSMDGAIRLADLELPPRFMAGLPGPRFGVEGLRRLLGVADRPLVMSIFKPCVGLTPDDLAAMFREQAEGGADMVKDDEILPDLESCPTERRLERCLEAARDVESATGNKTLYAVNLTGRAGEIVGRARDLARRGASCFLLNVLAYGYGTLEALARDPEVGVPIVAHPAVSGALGGARRATASPTTSSLAR